MRKLALSLLICFISLMALTRLAFAVPTLTLNELIQIALQNNNDLKAAQSTIELAKARLVQAGLWSNPSLNLGNTDDRLLSNEGEYTRSVGFSQAFPISGRIGKLKNVANVDLAIAIAEVQNAKRLLKGLIANQYYALLITDYRLKQLRKLLAINKKLVQVTHNRFLAAEVSELDSNTASLEYQRILQEKQILESQRFNQVALLNQLLGRDVSSALLLIKILPKPELRSENFKDMLEQTVKQRPDMQMLCLSLNRAQANQQLVRSERWADWVLGVAVQQNKIVVKGAEPQDPNRALSVNLAIPLPILNGNQGKIREAGALGTQAMIKMQALKLVIQTELASNFNQLQALEKALQQSHLSTLKLRNRNVNLARNAYKNGQISLLEVLQIQRQQNDLQVAYLNMLEKYLQAFVKLCAALGDNNHNNLCPFMSVHQGLIKRNLDASTRKS
ncbi:MAG: TolC family protein [Tatlockia sp.]|nr:TolC family protein [Tatlockia sp.]